MEQISVLDMTPASNRKRIGPYKATIILHGGAGAITRANLSPDLYAEYHKALFENLTDNKNGLDQGISALDTACRAVSRMEDNPLFNCGRGSVFTEAGTIEMEASVMVSSINPQYSGAGCVKRSAAVSLVKNTRYPIMLAKQVLLSADEDDGLGGTSTMHCHLSGVDVEKWGWEKRGLERKEFEWFWTERRWNEHRRGLHKDKMERRRRDGDEKQAAENHLVAHSLPSKLDSLPSQGTVGAVCVDTWGNIAVATSTGGLTNKKVGRIGDTPTVGAGFWAESWDEESNEVYRSRSSVHFDISNLAQGFSTIFQDCFSSASMLDRPGNFYHPIPQPTPIAYEENHISKKQQWRPNSNTRRAVAMSGTGNGDSFLRTNAVRTAASMCRFSAGQLPLKVAVTKVAGPGGELQQSAGNRWLKTGEGQGGIIGLEVLSSSIYPNVTFDFNCGGLWRAWYDVEPLTGREIARVMVFKDEY